MGVTSVCNADVQSKVGLNVCIAPYTTSTNQALEKLQYKEMHHEGNPDLLRHARCVSDDMLTM